MVNIDEIIKQALRDGDHLALNTARLLKAEILKYKTSKGAKPYTDVIEMQIISKMIKQREESIHHYNQGGRPELAQKEIDESAWLAKLLPPPVSEEDIIKFVEYWYPNGIEKKDMGKVIKEVKEAFPRASGNAVAEIVKTKLI